MRLESFHQFPSGDGLAFFDFCFQLIRKEPAKYLIFTNCDAEIPEASEESRPVLTPLMPQHMAERADRHVDALLPSLGKGQTIPVCVWEETLLSAMIHSGK